MRDVLVAALDPTTELEFADAESSLWLSGRGPVAGLGEFIMVVPGDPDDLRSFLADVPGTWLVIGSPGEVPEWGEPFDALFAAWVLTCDEELVVVENGGSRPDDDQYFEILGGCGQ